MGIAKINHAINVTDMTYLRCTFHWHILRTYIVPLNYSMKTLCNLNVPKARRKTEKQVATTGSKARDDQEKLERTAGTSKGSAKRQKWSMKRDRQASKRGGGGVEQSKRCYVER